MYKINETTFCQAVYFIPDISRTRKLKGTVRFIWLPTYNFQSEREEGSWWIILNLTWIKEHSTQTARTLYCILVDLCVL